MNLTGMFMNQLYISYKINLNHIGCNMMVQECNFNTLMSEITKENRVLCY